MEFVKRGMDPTSIAVMMEDGAAVAGLGIAGAATALTWYTGNSMWDAVGSIAIGSLLSITAVFLIQKNRQLLIGRSMQDSDMRKVLNHLRKDPVVKAVYDAKSEEIGPGVYRFKAEIDFVGEAVVERHMERLGQDFLYGRMKLASQTNNDNALDMCLKEYGKDMIGALGAEVDRLEQEVSLLVPGLRHIDLETDRGRQHSGSQDEPYQYPVPQDWNATQQGIAAPAGAPA
jgi:zinc transporter 9